MRQAASAKGARRGGGASNAQLRLLASRPGFGPHRTASASVQGSPPAAVGGPTAPAEALSRPCPPVSSPFLTLVRRSSPASTERCGFGVFTAVHLAQAGVLLLVSLLQPGGTPWGPPGLGRRAHRLSTVMLSFSACTRPTALSIGTPGAERARWSA